MKDFAFHRPTTLAEAVRLVQGHEGAKFLAGGQSLLPVLKLELAEPSDLVSLAQLKLRDIRVDGSNLVIGALATSTTSTTPVSGSTSTSTRCVPPENVKFFGS